MKNIVAATIIAAAILVGALIVSQPEPQPEQSLLPPCDGVYHTVLCIPPMQVEVVP